MMNLMQNRKCYIDVLKVFAIFMVLNSHFDTLYPNSMFACGGAAANSLFFIISGYFCVIRDSNGGGWLYGRIIKLYIPVWILTGIKTIVSGRPDSFLLFLKRFIWPTDYWFIAALVIFYIIFLFLNKLKKISCDFKLITFIFLVLYFAYYLFLFDRKRWDVEASGLLSLAGSFKLIYYFYIFWLGNWIRQNNKIKIKNTVLLLVIGISSFLGSLLVRLFIVKGIIPKDVQFLSQFLNIVFSFAMMITFLNSEQWYLKHSSLFFRTIIQSLSNLSLEIYLVQFDVIKYGSKILFPINIIFTVIVVIILAFFLNRISFIVVRNVT